MNHTPSRLREEAIKEFLVFCSSPITMHDSSNYGESAFLAGAKFAFEKAVKEVGNKYCSDPDRPYENILGSDIMHTLRQLGESLK